MTRPHGDIPPRDTATHEPHRPIAYPDPRAPQEPIILAASTEFIGCLLQTTAADAVPVLDLVNDDDPATELDRYALRLIRDLVARNVTPTCAAVLQHALTTADPTDRLHREQLTTYLVDAKFNAHGANLHWMAGAVLEQAYRRAGVEYAARIVQAADEASLDGYEQVLADRDQLRDLWRRHRIARGDSPVQEVGAA